MLVNMLKGKIHRAVVKQAELNLNYSPHRDKSGYKPHSYCILTEY